MCSLTLQDHNPVSFSNFNHPEQVLNRIVNVGILTFIFVISGFHLLFFQFDGK